MIKNARTLNYKCLRIIIYYDIIYNQYEEKNIFSVKNLRIICSSNANRGLMFTSLSYKSRDIVNCFSCRTVHLVRNLRHLIQVEMCPIINQ